MLHFIMNANNFQEISDSNLSDKSLFDFSNNFNSFKFANGFRTCQDFDFNNSDSIIKSIKSFKTKSPKKENLTTNKAIDNEGIKKIDVLHRINVFANYLEKKKTTENGVGLSSCMKFLSSKTTKENEITKKAFLNGVYTYNQLDKISKLPIVSPSINMFWLETALTQNELSELNLSNFRFIDEEQFFKHPTQKIPLIRISIEKQEDTVNPDNTLLQRRRSSNIEDGSSSHDLNKKEKRCNKLYKHQCPFCGIFNHNGQSKGGHIRSVHPGMSTKYKLRMKAGNERELSESMKKENKKQDFRFSQGQKFNK